MEVRATIAHPEWSPARIFLALTALYLIPLATIGFAQNSSFPTSSAGASDSALVFGVLETNGWHNLAGMLIGIAAAIFTFRPTSAREAALWIGIIHVIVTLGFIVWDPATFWFASNAADNVMHAMFAVAGVATGLMTPKARSTL